MRIKAIIAGLGLLSVIGVGYSDGLGDLFDLSAPASNNSSCTNHRCDIYLNDEITGPTSYQSIAKDLDSYTAQDTVYLHLAGMGGDGYGLVYLVNALKNTKAHTVSVVEGPVASAHAILAMATQKVEVKGHSFFYFHAISTRNMVDDVCSQMTGKDRGLYSVDKCRENEPVIIEFFNKTIDPIAFKVLNADEQKAYVAGHDIILDSEVVKKRLGIN